MSDETENTEETEDEESGEAEESSQEGNDEDTEESTDEGDQETTSPVEEPSEENNETVTVSEDTETEEVKMIEPVERNGKVIVRFISSNSPYVAGDTAGFPMSRARILVERGKAVYYKEPTADPEAAINVKETRREKRKSLKKRKLLTRNRMVNTD